MKLADAKELTYTDGNGTQHPVQGATAHGVLVWPKVTDVALHYSSGDKLLASGANYAWVTATVNGERNVTLAPVIQQQGSNFYVDGTSIKAHGRGETAGDELSVTVVGWWRKGYGRVTVTQQANTRTEGSTRLNDYLAISVGKATFEYGDDTTTLNASLRYHYRYTYAYTSGASGIISEEAVGQRSQDVTFASEYSTSVSWLSLRDDTAQYKTLAAAANTGSARSGVVYASHAGFSASLTVDQQAYVAPYKYINLYCYRADPLSRVAYYRYDGDDIGTIQITTNGQYRGDTGLTTILARNSFGLTLPYNTPVASPYSFGSVSGEHLYTKAAMVGALPMVVISTPETQQSNL